jgi:hypothetical protein
VHELCGFSDDVSDGEIRVIHTPHRDRVRGCAPIREDPHWE